MSRKDPIPVRVTASSSSPTAWELSRCLILVCGFFPTSSTIGPLPFARLTATSQPGNNAVLHVLGSTCSTRLTTCKAKCIFPAPVPSSSLVICALVVSRHQLPCLFPPMKLRCEPPLSKTSTARQTPEPGRALCRTAAVAPVDGEPTSSQPSRHQALSSVLRYRGYLPINKIMSRCHTSPAGSFPMSASKRPSADSGQRDMST